MGLTRELKVIVQPRIARDQKYRKEVPGEGIECALVWVLDIGKAILRDYIKCRHRF